MRPTLTQTVANVLGRTAVMPHLLELEITETAVIENIEVTHATLADLHQMGVNISMDDFGTGYSSLNYLKKFPFHTLKIDQSFVRDLLTNPKDVAIVRAIVALAQGLNLRVVAEGVETEALKTLLRSLNCDYMQGYWFSRPLSPEDATQFLSTSAGVGQTDRDQCQPTHTVSWSG